MKLVLSREEITDMIVDQLAEKHNTVGITNIYFVLNIEKDDLTVEIELESL